MSDLKKLTILFVYNKPISAFTCVLCVFQRTVQQPNTGSSCSYLWTDPENMLDKRPLWRPLYYYAALCGKVENLKCSRSSSLQFVTKIYSVTVQSTSLRGQLRGVKVKTFGTSLAFIQVMWTLSIHNLRTRSQTWKLSQMAHTGYNWEQVQSLRNIIFDQDSVSGTSALIVPKAVSKYSADLLEEAAFLSCV